MKTLDLSVFISVLSEMLGPLLWILVAVAALGTAALVAVLIRDRGVSSARLVRSELCGLVGGFAAVGFMQAVTHSGLGDIGGPIDWILVALIWLAGAIGATILCYALLGLLQRPGSNPHQR